MGFSIYIIESSRNLQKQAFKNNINAFRNGLYFSNLRFLTNNPYRNQTDQWFINGIGLDFNPQGFPIGTDITNTEQMTPKTLANCQQIWQFVLGPLQPELSLMSNKKNSYWVEFNRDKRCVFHPKTKVESSASYNPFSGKVFLEE